MDGFSLDVRKKREFNSIKKQKNKKKIFLSGFSDFDFGAGVNDGFTRLL